ncbi:MAG TPA: hypothetical protein VJB59_01605 [Bdellovibrionota bacterium]|nr:hypothetical protein [Bdellovibrionota bacterium]
MKKKYLYGLLILAAAIILPNLWGIAFSSGDDPFIAVDRFRKGGVWPASVGQATGQGRFYYVLPWTLSQLPYLWDSFAVVNSIKIVSKFLMFSAYFLFIREFYDERMALLTGFIGVALFDTIGGSIKAASD